mmetsp:Transcript_31291/g.66596  ORF Transcript_31291/g.66596 Transcript_31291/m.66596 type:complete len:253 (+) Transcript_31291:243-1001(+)
MPPLSHLPLPLPGDGRPLGVRPPQRGDARGTPRPVPLLVDAPRVGRVPREELHDEDNIPGVRADTAPLHVTVCVRVPVSDEPVGSVLPEGEQAERGRGAGVQRAVPCEAAVPVGVQLPSHAQVRHDALRLLQHHVRHVHHPLLRNVLLGLRPPPHPRRVPLHPLRLLPQDAPAPGHRARGRTAAGGRGRAGREGERGHTADEAGRREEGFDGGGQRRRRGGVAGKAEPERAKESHRIGRRMASSHIFVYDTI